MKEFDPQFSAINPKSALLCLLSLEGHSDFEGIFWYERKVHVTNQVETIGPKL